MSENVLLVSTSILLCDLFLKQHESTVYTLSFSSNKLFDFSMRHNNFTVHSFTSLITRNQ